MRAFQSSGAFETNNARVSKACLQNNTHVKNSQSAECLQKCTCGFPTEKTKIVCYGK